MRTFMDQDFLLQTETARQLYHNHAAQMPIIDYHCHIPPEDIARDKRFPSITEIWLGGDHYKWRLMRAAGIAEDDITGAVSTDPYKVFSGFAAALSRAPGNPLYHWSHLELQRYFDIHEPLNADSAERIYALCNERLAQPDMSARNLITRSGVALLCTTDDPADTLTWHERIREDDSFTAKVLPAFRPDKALNVEKPDFAAYMNSLSAAWGKDIGSFKALTEALLARVDFFQKQGCRSADHGLDYGFCAHAAPDVLESIFQKGRKGAPVSAEEGEQFRTALLCALSERYKQYGWVMQLHFGCLRNNNSAGFARLGPDTGFDCINGDSRPQALSGLLNAMRTRQTLPRTVLYSLNPVDNEILMTVAGCFMDDAECPNMLQLGSAWWFNDHKAGMEKQLSDYAAGGRLGGFIGMLTDSRSFLSYPRHEYFRRILCNYLGNLTENGEYPHDMDALSSMTRDICYHNTRTFFNFPLK